MIEKKKIELDKTRTIIDRLNEVPGPVISAQQFIVLYFDELQKSGKSLKAIHQFLQANGIDIGTYESFRTVYRRIKRSRKIVSCGIPPKPEKSTNPEKSVPAPPKAETTKDAEGKAGTEKPPQRLPGLGLRPLYLADGTEIDIDPETGAKRFKIKSNRRPEE
jgi:hypothetical protein